MNLLNPNRLEMDGVTAVSALAQLTIDALDYFSANASATWQLQHDPDGTHRYFTDDATGIGITPGDIFGDVDCAFRFDVTDGVLDIVGTSDVNASARRLTLRSQWDGAAGSAVSEIYLTAKHNPTTGTPETAEISLSASSGTGTITISSDSVSIGSGGGTVAINGTTISFAGSTVVRVTTNFDVDGTLNVDGTANFEGATVIDDTLTVTGAVDLDSTLNVDGLASFVPGLKISATNFSSLPGSPVLGMLATVTDSGTNTWGATVTGGGPSKVLAFYNGTNWTCVGI